ncbi:MAG: MFS transporter [Chloroflexi bacterium]|nr:MFS transporter [Chloroflexota bacterium]
MTTANTFAAFQYSNFRRYFTGQLISFAGLWMHRVALGWFVYQLTGSEVWLGIIAFVSGFPSLLFSTYAGVLADRYSRRTIMMVSYAIEAVFAITLGLLTLAGVISIGIIAIFALASGITTAFSEPTRQAFIRDIVDLQNLNSGIAVNAIMGTSAAMIGPGIAGVLLVAVGPGWCFVLNGLSFLAIIFSLWSISIVAPPRSHMRPSSWQDLRTGLHYIRHHNAILPLYLLAVATSILGINMLVPLFPAFAADVLDSPTVAYTFLNVALGFGSIVGSLFNVWIGAHFGRGKSVLLTAAVLPAAALIFSRIGAIPASTTMMGLLGFGYATFFITTNILIQTQVPDELRGRVISLWALLRFGLAPVAALGIGFLAQFLGLINTIMILSVLAALICWLVVTRAQNVLRRL